MTPKQWCSVSVLYTMALSLMFFSGIAYLLVGECSCSYCGEESAWFDSDGLELDQFAPSLPTVSVGAIHNYCSRKR